MYTIKKRLGELLLESGIITEAQLQTALEEQRSTKKSSVTFCCHREFLQSIN